MARPKLYKKTRQFSVRLTLKEDHAIQLEKMAKKFEGGKAGFLRYLIEQRFTKNQSH